jgi:5'-3' exoribonuclease 1
VCKDYLQGVQWILSYYTRGIPSWRWFYPHHYAPFAGDLAKYAEQVPPSFAETQPLLPFQQLLSVLPPASRQLIPEPLDLLLDDEKSSIAKYYPREFEIDMAGKRNDWEGVVLLPILDFDKIVGVYRVLESRISAGDMKRNIVGKTFVYRYDPQVSYVFKCHYGYINNCHVRVNLVDL